MKEGTRRVGKIERERNSFNLDRSAKLLSDWPEGVGDCGSQCICNTPSFLVSLMTLTRRRNADLK